MSKHVEYDMETISESKVPSIKKAYREYIRASPKKKEQAKERLDIAVDDWVDEPRLDIMSRGGQFTAPSDFEERRREELLKMGYNSAKDHGRSAFPEDLHYFPKGTHDFICPRGQEFVQSYVRKDGVRVEGYCRDLPDITLHDRQQDRMNLRGR